MTAETPIDVLLVGLFFVGIVLTAFVFSLRAGISALIFVRPLCDRLFESGRIDIAGYTLSFGAIMNAVVICAFMLNFKKIRESVPPRLRNIWLPFLLVALLSISYSPDKIDATRKILTYVSFVAMFMFPFFLIKSEYDAFRFIKLVIASSVLPVVYGSFQVISGVDWYSNRIHSTFSHPNVFAFYIMTIAGAILFILTARTCTTQRLRLVLKIYLVPLLILLIMTKTRSAWIACFLLFLAYGLIADRKVLIFVVTAPVFALFVPAIRDRIDELATGNEYSGWVTQLNSYAWRELLWEKSLSYIWQNPIFGYGLDSFHFYSPLFFPLEPEGTHAHNVYIQVLFESGLIGLIAFIWLFWRLFSWLLRYSRGDTRSVMMATAMIGVYIVACYSDNLLEYLSVNWCFWFTCGAILWRIAQSPSRVSGLGRRQRFGSKSGVARPAVIGAGAAGQLPRTES